MPPLKGIDLKGRPVSVAPSSKPLIVYVFHSACGWCERNLDNIEALAAATDGDYEFVAATAELAGIDEYLAARSLSWRVVAGVSHKLLTEYGVDGTPYTLVLSRDGKVEHAWTGAFDESKSAEVSRVFGVKLPGLRPPKS
jgi:hypothetical protein